MEELYCKLDPQTAFWIWIAAFSVVGMFVCQGVELWQNTQEHRINKWLLNEVRQDLAAQIEELRGIIRDLKNRSHDPKD